MSGDLNDDDDHPARRLDDVKDRRRVRRRFAQSAAAGAILIIGVVIFAVAFDDAMTKRVNESQGVLGMIFAALMLYLGHYTQVGSQESREQIRLAAAAKGPAVAGERRPGRAAPLPAD